MRVPQSDGTRGSLKWLQGAVNYRPDLLDCPKIGVIDWLSPLESDDYAEYSDTDFLDRLGIGHLSERLAGFWPRRGPQWDALGRSGEAIILVEAKAHIGEFLSPPTAAKGSSREQIERALTATKTALRARDITNWMTCFYQYTNRLSHLHFLRSNSIDAHLMLVGFTGDTEMSGPASGAEWKAAYRVANHAIGLPERHPLSSFVHHIFPDVSALR